MRGTTDLPIWQVFVIKGTLIFCSTKDPKPRGTMRSLIPKGDANRVRWHAECVASERRKIDQDSWIPWGRLTHEFIERGINLMVAALASELKTEPTMLVP